MPPQPRTFAAGNNPGMMTAPDSRQAPDPREWTSGPHSATPITVRRSPAQASAAPTARQAERWGRGRRGASLDHVLPRAWELAESLAARPQLLTRYLALTVR
jgi:hypothetical protein